MALSSAQMKFKIFSKCYGFRQSSGGPHYLQGKEEGERAVETVKNVFKKKMKQVIHI